MGILPVQVLGAVVTQRRVRVRLVDNNPLHEAGESGDHFAVSGRLHLCEDIRLHLQVPGVIGLGPLHNGAGCRDGVAAAFENYAVEYGVGPR